jgi:diguanylate cyclase (GGDEF)-like protein/PAS domain S-box-containing protein
MARQLAGGNVAGRRTRDGNHEHALEHALVERSTAALVTVEPSGTIRFASPAAARLLGADRADLPGRNLAMICDGDEGSRLLLYLDQLASGPAGRSAYIAVNVRHPDQSLRTIEVTGVNLVADESVRALALLLVDVTGRARLEDQLSRLATTDALTGLLNRRGLEQALLSALDDLEHGRIRELAVCFLDLDGFKNVNDAYGHAAGDQVLLQLAERLDLAVRRDDVVSRAGGDEFVILLRDPGDLEALMPRIFDALAEPVQVETSSLKVGASVGLALTSTPTSAGEMLRRADAALYRAKGSGKGRWSRYDVELDQWLTARRSELEDLQTHYESLRQSNAALQEALRTDALTRLPNRLQVDHDLEIAAARASEEGLRFAVAFIDIDEFGQFNKRFSQAVGDAVLAAVAQVLQASCRDVDTVYRLGGEEFVALFPDASVHEAGRIADRMRRRVETEVHGLAGLVDPVTVSIGVAGFETGAGGGHLAVIDAADAAMRGAKTTGKNRVTLALGSSDTASD